MGLSEPKTLEEAIRQRDSWIETARHYAIGVEYYRGQRDAFLKAGLNQTLADTIDRVVGRGWENLIDSSDDLLEKKLVDAKRNS